MFVPPLLGRTFARSVRCICPTLGSWPRPLVQTTEQQVADILAPLTNKISNWDSHARVIDQPPNKSFRTTTTNVSDWTRCANIQSIYIASDSRNELQHTAYERQRRFLDHMLRRRTLHMQVFTRHPAANRRQYKTRSSSNKLHPETAWTPWTG